MRSLIYAINGMKIVKEYNSIAKDVLEGSLLARTLMGTLKSHAAVLAMENKIPLDFYTATFVGDDCEMKKCLDKGWKVYIAKCEARKEKEKNA